MRALPPLDAHAHVLTTISERDLRALRSAVFAVTREPNEWDRAAAREDEWCIWGVGCHPGVSAAVKQFDADRFAATALKTPLIGEVGLDGRSKVAMAEQVRVFRTTLEVAKEHSRLVSVHSVQASAPVLDELERIGGVPGVILHWWRGNASETRRAVELGCYFSLNGAEAKRPKVLATLPTDRVLTETDFPHTRRTDASAKRPGAVATIEQALTGEWGLADDEVRRQMWRNLAALCNTTRTASLMPRRLQASLLTAR